MYSVVAAVIILLIGLIATSILFFGRTHPVLDADLQENLSRENRVLDNTTDSSASSEMMILAEPSTGWCAWLSLKIVFRFAALLHVVAIIWAFLGVFWHYLFSDMQCDVKVKEVGYQSNNQSINSLWIPQRRLLISCVQVLLL
jgi:hypothetical protein